MTTNPRLVLDQLIAAFENHYEVTSSDQVDEQALLDAEEALSTPSSPTTTYFLRSMKSSFLSTSLSLTMRKTKKMTMISSISTKTMNQTMTTMISSMLKMRTMTTEIVA